MAPPSLNASVKNITVVTHLVAHSVGGTIQLVAHGFGRTLILAGTSDGLFSWMFLST